MKINRLGNLPDAFRENHTMVYGFPFAFFLLFYLSLHYVRRKAALDNLKASFHCARLHLLCTRNK